MALLTFDTQHKPRQAAISMAAVLILMLIFPFVASQFGNSWVRIIDIALLYIMLALGLNIVVGFAGLLDLGYIAFFAVGAYLVGLFSSPQFAALLESLIYYSPALGEALVAFFGPEIAANGIHLSLWAIVPLAALCGALLLLAADYAAQHLFLPYQLPVGVITVSLGGLYLIALLVREARRQ